MLACAPMFMQRRALMLTFVLALCAAGCVRSGSPFVNPKKDASGAEGAVTTDDGGDSDGVTVVDGDGTSDTDSTGTGDDSTGADDSAADGDGSGTDTGTGTGSPRPGGLAPAVVATWNLHNFSKYGSNEFRLDDIEATIEGLGVDVLAVQELKLKEGTTGDSEQAWDLLLDNLEGYDGVHAPWDSKDSTVGLIWNTATTTVDDWEVIFENEWSAFPRPPIDATVTVTRDGGESTFHVVVLHLKAFKDSVDRRREACKLLVEYEASHPDDDFVISTALPFCLVIIAMCVSLVRGLRSEAGA